MSGSEVPDDGRSGIRAGTGPGAGNAVGTSVLFVALVLGAVIAYFLSSLFAMSTDTCLDRCDTSPLKQAHAVTNIGIGLAFVVAVGGALWAGLRARSTWMWPLLGLLIVMLAYTMGASLAGSVK